MSTHTSFPRTFHITIDGRRIHCVRFGNGSELMIAFHGFGNDAWTFYAVEPAFGKRFTMVAVDLPFHGRTEWEAGQKFTPEQARHLVAELMRQHGVSKVSLAAFSVGGKVALKVFEQMPEVVETLWLFAPDGLTRNVWYELAVNRSLGRKLFRYLIDSPKLVNRLLNGLHKVGIFPKELTRFLQAHYQSRDVRERVWNTWLSLAGFEIPPRRLKHLLNKQHTPIYIFMGLYDPVSKVRTGKRFVRGVPSAHLEILPKGHALLRDYLNPHIERLLTAAAKPEL